MWNLMYKINSQNRSRLIAIRRKRVGGLGEKCEGIKKKKKNLSQIDNSKVINGGKGEWGRQEMVKGVNGDRRGRDRGGEHTVQHTEEVL